MCLIQSHYFSINLKDNSIDIKKDYFKDLTLSSLRTRAKNLLSEKLNKLVTRLPRLIKKLIK